MDVKDIIPITKFPEVYQKSKKGLYRVALYDFLSDAAASCNYNEVIAPESVNIDEEALEHLITWACDGFKPAGPPVMWQETETYHCDFQRRHCDKDTTATILEEGECVACHKNGAKHDHPLFFEKLCTSCLGDFTQCAFVFGEDGTGLIFYTIIYKTQLPVTQLILERWICL